MFLKKRTVLAMLASRRGDCAGQVCELSTAGRNVCAAREWQSHAKSSAAEIWRYLEHCTSLWKENTQRESGFTVLPGGQLLSEGDLDIAFLSGLREKKVMQR